VGVALGPEKKEEKSAYARGGYAPVKEKGEGALNSERMTSAVGTGKIALLFLLPPLFLKRKKASI